MLFGVLHRNRLECAGTDVERDRRLPDPFLPGRCQNFRREMKSGGGRRDRAGLLRVNGLIAFGVGVFIAPGDVGRQGDVAVTLLKPIGVRGGEADPEGSVPVAGLDFETVAPRMPSPRRKRASWCTIPRST